MPQDIGELKRSWRLFYMKFPIIVWNHALSIMRKISDDIYKEMKFR